MSLERLQKVAEDLATACVKSVKSEVQKAHAETFETVQSSDVITRRRHLMRAMFRQYMRMYLYR